MTYRYIDTFSNWNISSNLLTMWQANKSKKGFAVVIFVVPNQTKNVPKRTSDHVHKQKELKIKQKLPQNQAKNASNQVKHAQWKIKQTRRFLSWPGCRKKPKNR